MFMLYAVGIGLAVGLLLGGRLQGLAAVRFRWSALALAGLLAQVALFSAPISNVIGYLGPPLYVASSAAVLAVVLRNITIPGLPIVALGAASNVVAIIANGGWMPASTSALAAIGETVGPGYSNSRVLAAPALAPLTDVLALPRWLPFANVFSVGDVLIAAGVAVAIAIALRQASRTPAATTGIPLPESR